MYPFDPFDFDLLLKFQYWVMSIETADTALQVTGTLVAKGTIDSRVLNTE